MNEVLALFSMCFAFCFFLESVENAIEKKKNKLYLIAHIGYSAFIVGAMVYFLATGVV